MTKRFANTFQVGFVPAVFNSIDVFFNSSCGSTDAQPMNEFQFFSPLKQMRTRYRKLFSNLKEGGDMKKATLSIGLFLSIMFVLPQAVSAFKNEKGQELQLKRSAISYIPTKEEGSLRCIVANVSDEEKVVQWNLLGPLIVRAPSTHSIEPGESLTITAKPGIGGVYEGTHGAGWCEVRWVGFSEDELLATLCTAWEEPGTIFTHTIECKAF